MSSKIPILNGSSDVFERITALSSHAQGRVLIGICGKPGSGKSTFTEMIARKFPKDLIAIFPMDGFHLSNETLKLLGKSDTKGAPDTFDVSNFAAVLKALRSETTKPVYFPIFDRSIEGSIENAGVIDPSHKIVIVEGNYLLHDEDGWELIKPLLDEVWMLEIDDEIRLNRLIARHIRYGKSPEDSQLWATGTDQKNAELIERNKSKADFILLLN